MSTIYFSDYQKRQFINFLRSIFENVTNCLECNLKSFHSNRTESICVLTLKFSKWGKYVTIKSYFKQFYEKNVFFKRYDKNDKKSYICVKSSQHNKLL